MEVLTTIFYELKREKEQDPSAERATLDRMLK